MSTLGMVEQYVTQMVNSYVDPSIYSDGFQGNGWGPEWGWGPDCSNDYWGGGWAQNGYTSSNEQSFFNSGVDPTTGERFDGQPLGYGCGTADSDRWVPDYFGRANLIDACRVHDVCYGTLGMSKAQCDIQFGSAISSAVLSAGYSQFLADLVGGIYQRGVEWFGQSAYDAAQQEAAGANHIVIVGTQDQLLAA